MPGRPTLPPLAVLRALFEQPEALRPQRTTAQVTEEAAAQFGKIAQGLVGRGQEPHAAAHFLIRLLFCLFAEDVGLLPSGLFTRLLANFQEHPERFTRGIGQLFGAMAQGGEFGADAIKHFNGGLFEDAATLPLEPGEIAHLARAAALDWSQIEPSIFGTLFERSLDPKKRSQLGAHYTSQADIERIVEPVLLLPLRRRWERVREEVDRALSVRSAVQDRQAPGVPLSPADRGAITRAEQQARSALQGFSEELSRVRVLDPACGSGNFLYVSLRGLLSLEKSVISFASSRGLTGFFPRVGPEQMRGIELNEYAAELAPVTVWIGYIQWLRENGFGQPEEPILRAFEMVQEQDALMDAAGQEATWPEADYLVGNPPFLGGSKLRRELGDAYTARLRALYAGRVEGGADLVCYWFEKARALIAAGKLKRAGLLATNSIRHGANREVLERIKESGDLFFAWSDREWILEGASVRVSMVGFDGGEETERTLDGRSVATINADLSSRPDVTSAQELPENAGLVFLGMMKAGPFDLEADEAARMLRAAGNPNGRPNSDVIRPRVNGKDLVGRPSGGYVVDFSGLVEADASLYEAPFEYVREHVKPLRDVNRDALMRQNWWLFGRTRPALRQGLTGKARCIVTPEVAKHRLFVWMSTATVPDHTCHVFARDDDYFFGVLHSRLHEVWSLAVGNRMGAGNDPRYNSSRTFGTFPMPWPPGQEPGEDDSPAVKAIADRSAALHVAEAARRLVELRDRWLHPADLDAAELKKRTLTNLYNARPAWLEKAHQGLDGAVCAAYAEATGEPWPEGMQEAQILEKLLRLNHQRAGRARP